MAQHCSPVVRHPNPYRTVTATAALFIIAAVFVAAGALDRSVTAAPKKNKKPAGPEPAFVTPGVHRSEVDPGGKVRAMILTGQMNRWHDWKQTTPIMKRALERTGRFAVDIHTMPPKKSDLSDWHPKFEDYAVIVMNVDGDRWPQPTQERFEKYVAGGGGLAVVHSADNAWKDWKQWNEMIALGGWGGRKADFGPRVVWRDGKQVMFQDEDNKKCGSHGRRHDFVITMRVPDHPVCQGLPIEWMHVNDELYDSLRGPAKNLTVVGTAHSDPKNKGTGEHEPILMAITYGRGRIFHTTLGHHDVAMRCAGFQHTLARGSEWAATGKVTLKKPDDFPTKDQAVSREE